MRTELLILLFLVGCVSTKAYFCRQDPCDEILIQSINEARGEIYCAIYSFTLDPVSNALIDARNRGVEVKLLMESQQVNVTGSEFYYLQQRGLDIKLDKNSRLMHHKFCIIDNSIVLTGSYNWSEQATRFNDENLVVIKSAETAAEFRQEFDRIWDPQ